jgi:hypothetical protein
MPTYQNGKIYTIRSRSREDLVYVGSTTQSLAKRLGGHRRSYDMWKNGTNHKYTSFDVIDIGDSYIELLENYPCSNKNELHRREGQLIRSMDCVNKNIPGRTLAEYHQDNREELNAKSNKYRLANKETVVAYKKQYRLGNKEAIAAKLKQWRHDNKAVLATKKGKRIMCDYCQCTFTHSNKSRHIKSDTHVANYKQAYLECFGEEFTGVVPLHDY